VITIRTSDRNGPVIGVAQVRENDEVMLITNTGRILRCRVAGISTMGRVTQGVRLMEMNDAEEKLVAMARLAENDDSGGALGAPPALAAPSEASAPLSEADAGDAPESGGADSASDEDA
jgi:DNA gyrase subunit A